MRISVVLCTYNGAHFIEEQLESLLRQSRPIDELIIRDDVSLDATPEIIRSFIERNQPPNWIFVRNDSNLGFIRNFHAAVSSATGDWIAPCDQDDIWLPDKLLMLERICQRKPDAQLLSGSFEMIDAGGAPLAATLDPRRANGNLVPFAVKPGALIKIPVAGARISMLLGGNFFLGCTMMFSREVARVYAEHGVKKIAHDWEAALIGAALDGLYFLNKPLIRYRIHDRNAIGLPFGERADARRMPSDAGRRRIMDNYEAAIATYRHLLDRMNLPPLATDYDSYARLRREALEDRSFRKWLGLLRYHAIYANMFTLKQRLGDLYLILFGRG